jgi:hypothetical protein
MPLISHEESCRIPGLSAWECEAAGQAAEKRVRDARELCDTAFQHDLATRNACVADCSSSSMEVPRCLALTAAHQDIEANHQTQQLHILAAVFALILIAGAYLLGRRHRR